VTKFVGKFRKNKNYNDDYNYDYKRHRDEHSEIKKMISQAEASRREISEDIQIMLDEEDRK
jgi:hypothetical protein